MKNMDGELDDTSLSQCHEQESNATQGNESLIFFSSSDLPSDRFASQPRCLGAQNPSLQQKNSTPEKTEKGLETIGISFS